jgi:peptidoglycan L-alanyl-D-glutamate endopeptidase CwlK
MQGVSKLKGVHPDLVAVVNRAAELYKGEFKVTEGLRTLARQKQLKANGKSKTLNSRHLTGHAVDVSPIVDGSISWDKRDYNELGRVFKQAARELKIPIEWGGDWGWDFPHWQLPWKKYPKDTQIAEASDEPEYQTAKARNSRVIQGSTVAGGGGLGIMADGAMEFQEQIQEGADHWSSGDIIKMAIGGAILAGALWAIYGRWDLAGRPMPDFIEDWLERRRERKIRE